MADALDTPLTIGPPPVPAINENSENGLDEEPGVFPETTGSEPTPSDVQPSTDGILPKSVTFDPAVEETVSKEVGTPPTTVGTEPILAGMQPDQTGIIKCIYNEHSIL